MGKRILITGATGNVGKEVIRFLCANNQGNEIIAAVRNTKKGKSLLAEFVGLDVRTFDFEDMTTYHKALSGIDTLFLLRPPHISKVEPVFCPLIQSAASNKIKEIVFLSVQGADKMSFIPHAKIEKLVRKSGLPYIFLRPSYFMQNLSTTLADDVRNRKIVLPAGKAKFNWVDVANIGEAAAVTLADFNTYTGQELDITGSENLSFEEAVRIVNSILHMGLEYESPNLIRFFRHKKRQGIPTPMMMVMMMLHFLPRLQKPPRISENYMKLTQRKPTTLSEFVYREKRLFL